jgi:enolase
MSKIVELRGRQVFDSRGNPTIEVDARLQSGAVGRAAIPSGASTGQREAVELRDRGQAFGGKGVSAAVANVDGEMSAAIAGLEAGDQATVDRVLVELDGTATKERLGANAILGASLAIARAQASEVDQPLWRYLGGPDADLLPVPLLNVLNGGVHADNAVDFQEFMIVPRGAHTFAGAMQMAVETYHELKGVLRAEGLATTVGDEGGFAPALERNDQALELLTTAIKGAGYRPGDDIAIAVDPASSEFFKDHAYRLQAERRNLSADEMVDYWERLIGAYPIVLLEDGMAEDDWDGWRQLTARLGHRVQLVGDDVFVTNPAILRAGIDQGIANSILIKLNQIGTLTETLETIAIARAAGYRAVISHRSGETEDPLIADLVVATGVGQIKAGAPARSERLAKYNRLLRIEEQLGRRARFAGVPY